MVAQITFLIMTHTAVYSKYRFPHSEPLNFLPITNYTDQANRGISTQMKFEGRNVDITKPEPAHALQVW